MKKSNGGFVLGILVLPWVVITLLGVAVYSSAKDVQTGARERLTPTEITSLNSLLSTYEGTRVGGYQIISFLERVDVLNAREIFPTEIKAGSTSSITKDNIQGIAYYKLELKDTDNDGFYDVYIISNSPVSTNNG